MDFGAIKEAAKSAMVYLGLRPRFIVHSTQPACHDDDKLYPPTKPPATPTSVEAGSNQSFNHDWKMPRGLVWKTYWERFLADIKYHAVLFWDKNLGLILVLFAQVFAAIMSMTTRLLETGFYPRIHAIQIIFVRMLFTALLGCTHLYYTNAPDFPYGPAEIRGLLMLRSLFGTAGLYCLYYSLGYLDVGDATVITFLVPPITTVIAWIALNEPMGFQEVAAAVVAFVGVLFVARPASLFPVTEQDFDDLLGVHAMDSPAHTFGLEGGGLVPPVPATPSERGFAIVCAVVGSFAAASAYVTIRVIGRRAHPLVSVNYFAAVATMTSFLTILIHPDLHFELPTTILQWVLLVSVGLSGFVLQVFLTIGLQRERAGRATNLIYSQLIFALILEWMVWGTTPPWTSYVGSILIIGGAIWISLQNRAAARQRRQDPEAEAERRPLLNDRD